MIDTLKLVTGAKIPLKTLGAQLSQPTIEEIAYAGEQEVQVGCKVLLISKKDISALGNNDLSQLSNFDIFMRLICDESEEAKYQKNCAFIVLSLLFENFCIQIENESNIVLKNNETIRYINAYNFKELQECVLQIFCLNDELDLETGKEVSPLVKELQKKFEERKKKLQEIGSKNSDDNYYSLFGTILTILSTSEHLSLNELKKMTVYQLMVTFNRFMLKYNYDLHIQARLAGAKSEEEPKSWLVEVENIFKKDENNNGKDMCS